MREAVASMALEKKSAPKRFSRPEDTPPAGNPPAAPAPLTVTTDADEGEVSDQSLTLTLTLTPTPTLTPP